MAASLLEPPVTAADAQSLAQQADTFINSQLGWSFPYPLSLFINTESQEKWATYENLFLALLRTGDNEHAYLCLEELVDRFGVTNEHVTALKGLYKEATAKSQKELEDVMTGYDEILKEDPTVFAIRKRRAALLRSVGRTADAIDLYCVQGAYEQAVFCLEEVLLTMPNAWNIHAKMGEVQYMWATQKLESSSGEQMKTLSESMRRFCRSIELCDDYLRGFYGLKTVTGRLLQELQGAKKPPKASSDPIAGDLAPPSIDAVKKLNQLATAKLAEIVRRSSLGEKDWNGYAEAEIKAAKELIDSDTQKIER